MRVLICVLGVVLAGCSSDDDDSTSRRVDVGCPPVCSHDPAAPKCADLSKVQSCPRNDCMAPVIQTGDVSMMRISRQLTVAPASLVAITKLAVNPNVNPKCFDDGRDAFNWLLRIDKKAGTLRTGGARPSTDAKTYKFLDEDVDGTQLGMVCPGFVGAPLSLRPKTTPFQLVNGMYVSGVIDKLNIPIYIEPTPIVLPLTNVRFTEVQLWSDGSCIGHWEPDYWCDEKSLGWTTAGMVEGMILVADADKVPVKSIGCQSLCSLLVNDATKTNPDTKTCKKNPDGTYPELGDACIGGTGCKNAWHLRSAFAAYGVTIQ
jgi:hypothetical protein